MWSHQVKPLPTPIVSDLTSTLTTVFHTDTRTGSVPVADYWCFREIHGSFYCSVTLTGLTDFVRKAMKTTATGTQPTYSVYRANVVQKE